MKKILDFILRVAGKVGDFFKLIWNKIFRKQAEAEQRQKLARGLILGLVIALIVILGGWYAIARFWPHPAASNSASASQIAEAKVYILTSSACGKNCWDPQLFTDALAGQGVKIDATATLNVGGWWPFNQANDFVKEFKITKVPTVVVEFTGKNQPDITKFFSPTLGSVIDGKFVLTKILAPYYDLTAKKIKGIIKVTYLTDQSCAQCYDVKSHETALKNLGAPTANSETIDVSSPAGQALISKYNITKVPTLLISGEVSEYTVLTQAWADVGTIASDGTYVFTNLDLMGGYYKNLTTGKVIKANPPATTTVAPAPTAPAVK